MKQEIVMGMDGIDGKGSEGLEGDGMDWQWALGGSALVWAWSYLWFGLGYHSGS